MAGGQGMKSLGKLLKKQRLYYGFTRKALADKWELHQQFIYNWENGISNPPKRLLLEVCKELNIPQKKMLECLEKDLKNQLHRNLNK